MVRIGTFLFVNFNFRFRANTLFTIVNGDPVSRRAVIGSGSGYSKPISPPSRISSSVGMMMTLMQGPGSSGSKGFQADLTRGILCDEVNRLCLPDLLDQEISPDAEPRQTRLECVGVFIKKAEDCFVLNYRKPPSVGSRPLLAVLLKHPQFSLQWGCRHHLRPFQNLTPHQCALMDLGH